MPNLCLGNCHKEYEVRKRVHAEANKLAESWFRKIDLLTNWALREEKWNLATDFS